MAITFFDIMGRVLNQRIDYYAHHENVSIEEIDHRVLTEAERNKKEWYSDNIPNLNYNLMECRLAYLYIVAAANANTFKWILNNDLSLNTYIRKLVETKRNLKICAFGAGPGTELMALAKFFDELNLGYLIEVEFLLLEKVRGWLDSWNGIRDVIKETFRAIYGVSQAAWPILPSGNFTQQDVTDLEGMNNLGDVWTNDIFVVNFLLSELFVDVPNFRQFITTVASRAPKGARFVFIERSGPRWKRRMKRIADQAGLNLCEFKESMKDLDSDENPKLMGHVYQRLSKHPTLARRPRNRWKVTYSIGIKE